MMLSNQGLRHGRMAALLCALALPTLLPTLLPAQGVADKVVIAGRGNTTDGPGGLFLADPKGSGQNPVEVTGLPASLTGQPLDPVSDGASAVAVLGNLDLAVGNAVPPGGTVELFVVRVDAQAGASVLAQVGIGTNGGVAVAGVEEIEVLPSGDLLVISDGAVTRAGADARFSVVTGAAGGSLAVGAFPVSGVPAGDVVGAAIDAAAATVLVAIQRSATQTDVFSTSLAGGALVPVASVGGPGTGMTFDDAGKLVVSTPTELVQIDLTSLSQEVIRDGLEDVSGAAALALNSRVMLLRRHPSGARNYRVSTMRSKRRRAGFGTLTGSNHALGEARDLVFAAAAVPPPPPPPPVRLRGNPGGNVLVASEGSSSAGRGGLFLLNPTQFSAGALPILGLPNELTGLPLDGTLNGAYSVFVRQRDQRVFAGSGTTVTGDSCDLFELGLSANQATVIRQVQIGRNQGNSVTALRGGINQIDELPNGDLIVACSLGVTRRQGATEVPAFATTVSGNIVSRLTINPAPPQGDYNGLVVDRSRNEVFIAVVTRSGSSLQTDVIGIPANGGTLRQVARIADEVATGLALDNAGQLLVATLGVLVRVDPATGRQTDIQNGVSSINGVTNASPTGDMILLFGQNGDQVATQDPAVFNGPLGFLTRVGEDMGSPRDLHLLPSPHLVAAGTPRQNTYSWAVAPNPGGMAFPGNQAFSLTLTSDGATLPPAAVFLGQNKSPTTILGASFTVELTTAVAFPVWPTTTRHTIPLPVPNLPAFIDFRGFLQAAVLDPWGLASSDAVTFRVL